MSFEMTSNAEAPRWTDILTSTGRRKIRDYRAAEEREREELYFEPTYKGASALFEQALEPLLPTFADLEAGEERELFHIHPEQRVQSRENLAESDLRITVQRADDGLLILIKDQRTRRLPAIAHELYTEGVGNTGGARAYHHLSRSTSVIVCDDQGQVHDILAGNLESVNWSPNFQTGDQDWLEQDHSTPLNRVDYKPLKADALKEISDLLLQSVPAQPVEGNGVM